MDTSDDRRTQEASGAVTYSVPPVQRALALLRYVAAGNRCRNVSRAAKELGINRTTFIRLIATLQAERLVEEIDDGGGYRLGPGFLALAADALNARDVVQLARPVLAGLVRDLGLSAHFAVLDGREIVYLARQSPNAHLVSNVREGTRLPAHATTMGRILLAQLSPEELAARYSDADLASFTPKTATTVEALQTQLADDRALGIARSVANFELGIGSCACAVFDHLGRPAGAVNVSGPDAAFAPQNGRAGEIEAGLRAAADAISVSLGHRPDRVRAAAGLAQA
ncbi:IclR family transcriptional regulator [Amorphus sp. MBR-141]